MRHPKITRLATLPPKVEMYKITFRGDQELMHDLLPATEQQVADEVQATLAKRGYAVRPLDQQTLAGNPDLKKNFYTVQELFEKEIARYNKRMFRTFRKFEYSIGAEVNPLADATESNALTIVRCQAFKKTGGEIAKDLAKSALIFAATLGGAVVYSYPSVTYIQVAVLDGDTGDLLWYVDNAGEIQGEPFDIAQEKRLRKSIRALISKFPKAAKTNSTLARPEQEPTLVPQPTNPSAPDAKPPIL